jgi:threonine dehydrogenase-like Zn-dependent dehydrogenase
MERGEFPAEHFATHRMSLDDGPHGYEIFKEKKDGNVRSVFLPHGP